MKTPRLAIFIPCYNASSTIQDTLVSIQKAIKTAMIDIPVLIYDDCSTDDSVDVAKSAWNSSSQLTVIKSQQNSGERRVTNRAFNDFRDKYDWVFIIHADDIAKEDWLTTLIGHVNNPAYVNCFTIWSSYDSFNGITQEVSEGDNSGNVDYVERDIAEIKHFLTRVYCNWHISGAVLNVDLFHKMNGFDEKMAQFGDTDYFVRGLLAGYKDVYICRTLTLYRSLEGASSSVSSVSIKTNRDILEIFYMVQKFKGILTEAEIASMHRIVTRLSFRRMIKSLLKRNLSLALLNFKQFRISLRA